jgi:hypothetical protein
MKQNVVIFDIDGILADINHRYIHYKHLCNCGLDTRNPYHEDELNQKNYQYYLFFKNRGYKIYIFSSRSIVFRKETEKWLEKYNIIYDKLEMRQVKDYRLAHLVKEDFLNRNFGPQSQERVKAVFEDEKGCIEMYRRKGITKIYDCRQNMQIYS